MKVNWQRHPKLQGSKVAHSLARNRYGVWKVRCTQYATTSAYISGMRLRHYTYNWRTYCSRAGMARLWLSTSKSVLEGDSYAPFNPPWLQACTTLIFIFCWSKKGSWLLSKKECSGKCNGGGIAVMLPRQHAQVLWWMAICVYAHVQTVEYLHLCMLHSDSQQLISCSCPRLCRI